MRPNKIICGSLYRLKSSPNYTYVRPVAIFKPGTYQMKAMAKREGIKPFPFIVVKCEHMVNKDDTVRLIRYFRPVDIIKNEEENNEYRKET